MIIDDLTLIKQLGKGSFGEVFLTSKAGTKELFATKKINISKVAEERYIKYLNNELFILKNVNHPNIVKLYDIKQTLNNYYLVFDLCNGGGLSNCLERYQKKHDGKPFPENIVQLLMKQIVEGIKYLHNKKILHRDIKLDNILVKFDTDEDKDNDNYSKATIKIIDFGFARYLENDSLAQSILGSPINMDPKILMKYQKIDNNQSFGYDQKADIWSLGTVCYQLLIGVPPFNANSGEVLVSKIQKGTYTIPNKLNLSKQSISFINAMLQFDPQQRYDINQLAAHEFLVKDCNSFDKMNLTKAKNNSHISGKDIIMTVKDELKQSFWNLFDSAHDISQIKNEPVAQVPVEETTDTTLLPPNTEPILPGPDEKPNNAYIENQALDSTKEKNKDFSNVYDKSFKIDKEMEKFLLNSFEKNNQDFFRVEPILIPLIPVTNQKILELEL